MLALSERGHFVYRCNVGRFKMADGRWFDTGLPIGFSDLAGHRAGDARAFYLEVKRLGGHVTPQQIMFLEAMKSRGALAGVVRSIDDALKVVSTPL